MAEEGSEHTDRQTNGQSDYSINPFKDKINRTTENTKLHPVTSFIMWSEKNP